MDWSPARLEGLIVAPALTTGFSSQENNQLSVLIYRLEAEMGWLNQYHVHSQQITAGLKPSSSCRNVTQQ